MAANSEPKKAASIYEFSAKDIDGNEVCSEIFVIFVQLCDLDDYF